jgi:hypothetical protein
LFDEKAERAVVMAVIRQAKKGDVTAATWLWDRKYGKVKDRVEQSGGLVIKVIRGERDRDLSADAPPRADAGEA